GGGGGGRPNTKYIPDKPHAQKGGNNLGAALPSPFPPAPHPGTRDPAAPADLEPLFPMDLILQEVSGERFIEIPEPIRDVYRMWRPSPLMRAHRLEGKLSTPARSYFKYQRELPARPHQPHTRHL